MAQSLLLLGIDLRPTDALSAQRSLRTLVARLRQVEDPRAIFPEVYLRVTDRIVDDLAAGRFVEPAFTDDLVGYFAELYFDAIAPWLSGERPDCASWELAFAFAPDVLPVQAAVLGINAHINADLARVAARSIRRGDPGKVARYKLDYDRINDILVECMPGVIGQLAAAHGCPVARVAVRARLAERATIGVVMPLIRAWRERAWADAFRLLSSNEPERLVAAFDRRAALQARVLALRARRPAERSAPTWRPAAAAA